MVFSEMDGKWVVILLESVLFTKASAHACLLKTFTISLSLFKFFTTHLPSFSAYIRDAFGLLSHRLGFYNNYGLLGSFFLRHKKLRYANEKLHVTVLTGGYFKTVI